MRGRVPPGKVARGTSELCPRPASLQRSASGSCVSDTANTALHCCVSCSGDDWHRPEPQRDEAACHPHGGDGPPLELSPRKAHPAAHRQSGCPFSEVTLTRLVADFPVLGDRVSVNPRVVSQLTCCFRPREPVQSVGSLARRGSVCVRACASVCVRVSVLQKKQHLLRPPLLLDVF